MRRAKSVPVGLPEKLGYKFKKKKHVLEQALIHKSHGNESRLDIAPADRDNERLEFLGDAVLDFAVSDHLYELFPSASEGELSKRRAALVNERTLAELARRLGLGEVVLLGKGEESSGGRDKDSILSNLVEAVVAAIYLDGGMDAARSWVGQVFSLHFASSLEAQAGVTDYKTRLQERCQALFKIGLVYTLIKSEGPDHDKRFTVKVSLRANVLAVGEGKSKKEAEQSAASGAFLAFGENLEKLS
jgi:ribonuclease-3